MTGLRPAGSSSSNVRSRSPYIVNAKVRELSARKTGTCPECGQVLTEKHKAAMLKKYNVEMRDLSLRNSKLVDLQNADEALLVQHGKIEDCEAMIETYEAQIEELKSEKSKPDISNYESEIERDEKAMVVCRKKIEKINDELAQAEFWLKGFGSSGIVSLLLDDIINQFNAAMSTVCQEMTGGLVHVAFSSLTYVKSKDAYSDKISMSVYIDGKMVPYENLSDSERARVDVCVMLGWARALETNRTGGINVAFFDEIFDTMDEEVTSQTFKYIKGDKALRSKSVNVISHADWIKKEVGQRVITVRRSETRGSYLS